MPLQSDVAHTALGDARALAQVFRQGLPHLQPAQQAIAVTHNGRLDQPTRTLTRALAATTSPDPRWRCQRLELQVGQRFLSTGPQSMRTDTLARRGEQHGINLGLEYRKTSSIPKRSPPDFLLSTSLSLETTKMRQARELGTPVVLCRDLMAARLGSQVPAWVFEAGSDDG